MQVKISAMRLPERFWRKLVFPLPIQEIGYFDKVYVRYPEYDFGYHIFCSMLDYHPEVLLNEEEHKAFCWKTLQDALTMNLILDEDSCIKLFYGI